MLHHYSGLWVLDFSDPYAFPKPGNPRKSILIIS